jgi:hypothetical protein
VAQAVTLVLALLAYVASVSSCWDMHGSDAAGNALGQAFTIFLSIALWVLLAVLLVITAVKGGGPVWWNTAALVLFPICAVSNFIAIQLLMDNFYSVKWPMAVPVLMPLLLMFVAMQPIKAPAAVWGVLAALSLLPWPTHVYRAMYGGRDRERAAAEAKAAEPQRLERERLARVAAFEKLDDKSPLRDWLDFYNQEEFREPALARIRKSPRRQADVEEMMREGYTYLLMSLPEFDLEATPPICEGTRRQLKKLREEMQYSFNGRGPIYFSKDDSLQQYRPGIAWAVGHGCECKAELAAVREAILHFQDEPPRQEFLDFLDGLKR